MTLGKQNNSNSEQDKNNGNTIINGKMQVFFVKVKDTITTAGFQERGVQFLYFLNKPSFFNVSAFQCIFIGFAITLIFGS